METKQKQILIQFVAAFVVISLVGILLIFASRRNRNLDNQTPETDIEKLGEYGGAELFDDGQGNKELVLPNSLSQEDQDRVFEELNLAPGEAEVYVLKDDIDYSQVNAGDSVEDLGNEQNNLGEGVGVPTPSPTPPPPLDEIYDGGVYR